MTRLPSALAPEEDAFDGLPNSEPIDLTRHRAQGELVSSTRR